MVTQGNTVDVVLSLCIGFNAFLPTVHESLRAAQNTPSDDTANRQFLGLDCTF